LIPLLLVLAISTGVTYLMIVGAVFSDFLAHLDIWRFYAAQGKVPFPPLYYLSFYGISLIIPEERSLQIGLLLLMIFSWLAKYFLAKHFLEETGVSKLGSAWISLGLILLFPLYLFGYEGDWQYLGKMTQNVWHNGSSIFVWPLCFLLFKDTLHWLNAESKKSGILILWAILILLIKPSFLFGYIPGLAMILILREVPYGKRGRGILLILLFSALVGLSKYLIFDFNLVGGNQFVNFNSRNGVSIRPFAVWLHYAQYPFWDFLSSWLLLILAFVFFGPKLWNHLDVQFAAWIMIFALLVYFVFAEDGPGFFDANFLWQVPISSFILHLVLARRIWMLYQDSVKNNASIPLKFITLSIVAMGYVTSGIYYLVHSTTSGYYY
jgi:hypothetical protein